MSTRPRREDVRADILEHASAVFEREGYAKASLDKIAAEAGYTKGAVYSGFGGKPELFAEACSRRMEEISRATMARVEPALAGQADRVTIITELASALTSSTLDAPARWALLLHEFRSVALRDAAVDAVYQQLMARRVGFLVDLLDDNAYLSRLGRPTLERAAVILLSLANALAVEHVLAPKTVDREAVVLSIRGLLDAVLPD